MRNYFFLLNIIFLLLLSSCNSPMDKTYNAATYQEDIESIRQSNKVSEDDIQLLTKYILVSKLAGNDLQGKSYDEILDKIKEIRNANSNESDQAKLNAEAKRERLHPLLNVNLSEKTFSTINKKDCFTYTVIFQNTSSKNIKMIVGNISINDLLDREIKKIDILLDENLKAGATLKKTYTVEYDHSNENDKRIRSKELVDMRVNWNPEKIIFEDGHIAE